MQNIFIVLGSCVGQCWFRRQVVVVFFDIILVKLYQRYCYVRIWIVDFRGIQVKRSMLDQMVRRVREIKLCYTRYMGLGGRIWAISYKKKQYFFYVERLVFMWRRYQMFLWFQGQIKSQLVEVRGSENYCFMQV